MTDLSLDQVAERLMRMDPGRPGVGRLAQELVAALIGLRVAPTPVTLELRYPWASSRCGPIVPRELGWGLSRQS